jgi:diphthamide biosynthesis enzyme Dph1/Dph2-like protein
MSQQEYSLDNYNLELERAIKTIKKQKAKFVCLQFPEALKPLAPKVAKEIEQATKAKCLIWLGSCYGACDTPFLENVKPKIDLLIQWGHVPFNKAD